VPYYALLVLVTFWLALGTPYGLYALVYDWPGFTFIRVPSRFSILSLLGLAVLAAAGFDRLLASRSNRTRLTLTTIAMLVLAAEFIAAPLNTIPYGVDIPAVDRWLAQQPTPFVVAEVPLASPHDILGWTGRQSVYMLHSTAHWQKTIHGYSGMQPPFHDQLYAELTRFPNEDIIVRLASLGVSYIVVHTDLYPIDQRAVVTDRLGRLGELFQLVYADASGRVYAVRPARLESAR
jgi:hypothetical protein